jgi:protein-disulfide isomerase
VACQGGGHYQRLWGVPTHILAIASLVPILAALRWRPAWAPPLAWLAAGGSAYFLIVSWRLDLLCTYCLAVHTAVIAGALALRPVRWLHLALGALLLHAAYHPQVVADAPAEPEVGAFLNAAPASVVAAVPPHLDERRRLGAATAPFTIELAIDLHCPHCAASHGPLLAALRPFTGEQVQLIERFVVRPSAPSGGELATAVLAAGSRERTQMLIGLLLGTPEGRGWSAVRARVAEVEDVAALEAARAADAAGLAALLAADARRLARLRVRATPTVVLSRDGAEITRWSEPHPDAGAIAARVASEVGR